MIHTLNDESKQLLDLLASQTNWEARYRQLLLLGKSAPVFPEIQRTENEIGGCQAKVWVSVEKNNNRFYIHSSSDARIVKALLFVLTQPLQGATADEIETFDAAAWMDSCKLSGHLNPSRVNGLFGVIDQVKALTR